MKPKFRIVFIVQSLVKGGAERLIVCISNELIRRNAADVLIVGLDIKNEYPELSPHIPYVKINITYSLSLYRKNIINIQELTKVIEDFKPDIIHTNCYLQEAPARVNYVKHIAYFSHLHDNMPAFQNFSLFTLFNKRKLTDFDEKKQLLKLYRKCHNNFIAVSRDTYFYFNRSLPHSLSRNMTLLPNAIEFDKFYNEKHTLVPQDYLKLINIGHFAPKKNQAFLLKVLKILKDSNINVILTLIGDSETVKGKILAEAEKLGVQDDIVFTGVVNNVEKYLMANDIYVHSATYEPFGLVLLEAMAGGLPVVCLDGKGNRDIIKNGENGFMIDIHDPELFAAKIIDLITNPDLYNRISENAIKFASQYDIKEYVEKLLQIYKMALKK